MVRSTRVPRISLTARPLLLLLLVVYQIVDDNEKGTTTNCQNDCTVLYCTVQVVHFYVLFPKVKLSAASAALCVNDE